MNAEQSRRMKWDCRMLQVARLISTWSKDPSTQCGAVITDAFHNIVATGYNGFPRSMQDRDVWLGAREEKYSRTVHAEINAMIMMLRSQRQGHTIYCYPFIACDRCVPVLQQAGITRYVSLEPSDDVASRWSDSIERSMSYINEATDRVKIYPRVWLERGDEEEIPF